MYGLGAAECTELLYPAITAARNSAFRGFLLETPRALHSLFMRRFMVVISRSACDWLAGAPGLASTASLHWVVPRSALRGDSSDEGDEGAKEYVHMFF